MESNNFYDDDIVKLAALVPETLLPETADTLILA
jgi:hypothetical protein